MNLRLKANTLPLLRLPLGFPFPRRATQRWHRAFSFLKHLVFFGLILPFLFFSGLLFLAALGD